MNKITIALFVLACLGVVHVSVAQNINTIAGDGTASYTGDGVAATAAELNYPDAVALDTLGNIYIADVSNNRIRKISVSTGNISTVVGTGTGGNSGDGGQATAAQIANLGGIAVDDSGNIYMALTVFNIVRKVKAATGIITTIAGKTGSGGFLGDGGAATAARFNNITSVTVDKKFNVYLADRNNNRIRKITASTGKVNTVAGNGTAGYNGDGIAATAAELNLDPGGGNSVMVWDIGVDDSGSMYIPDVYNQRIRKVDGNTGTITTVAGNGVMGVGGPGDGGLADSAEFYWPTAVEIDKNHNLYITDNSNDIIREVDASTKIINTVVGNRSSGFSGDGGPATNAGLGYPYSVAVDASGNIYVPDDGNQRVREVNTVTTGIVAVNTFSSIGVYPNPADNYIYVKSNGLKGNITINLYNIEGKQMMSNVYSSKDNIQIPVKQIAPGLYFLKAELANGNTFMKKVIITR